MKYCCLFFIALLPPVFLTAQRLEAVQLVKYKNDKRISVFIGHSLFTQFLYPDSLEKPVLYPIYDAGNALVTRGFPMHPRPDEPTDHPHHLGLWLNYENVNGLDFWNNSYAIPGDKKSQYGWIKTDSILEMTSGETGELRYRAKWVDHQNQELIQEITQYEFSGFPGLRIIDRVTDLKAVTNILFTDAKDGMLGLRLTHELQMATASDQQFTDNKGNITHIKKDTVARGNYLTSEGKQGDSAWSSRAIWCKVYGRIGNDSVSITIFDHPANPGYPTFWHARGYGLFAANPLGKKVFTKGVSEMNLALIAGETIRFRYRILIQNGKKTPDKLILDQIAKEFAQKF